MAENLNKPGLNQPQQGQISPMAPPRANRVGSGFTNLQKVIGANQQNRLGSTIQSGIGQAAGGVKAGLQNAQGQFNQQLQANRIDTDANRQKIQNVLSNPLAVKAQDVKDFATFRRGAYDGPKTIGDVDILRGQAQEAEQLGQQVGSKGGQQALLQRFVGGNQYNQGQQRLDNLILGQTGAQQLKQSRRDALGLTQQVSDAEKVAQAQAQTAAGQARTFGDQTIQQIQGARNPISSELDARVKQFQDLEAERLGKTNRLKEILNTVGREVKPGEVNTQDLRSDNDLVLNALEEAAQAGYISGEDITKIGQLIPRAQDAKLNLRELMRDYMTNIDSKNISRGGLASEAEAAKLNALSALAGTDAEFNQLGGASLGQTGFDVGAIEKIIANEEARLKGEGPVYTPEQIKSAPQLNPLLYLTPAGMPLAAAGLYRYTGEGALRGATDSANLAGEQIKSGDVIGAGSTLINSPAAVARGAQGGLARGTDYAIGGLHGGDPNSIAINRGIQNVIQDQYTAVNPLIDASTAYIDNQRKALEQLRSGRVDQAVLSQTLGQVQNSVKLAEDVAKGVRDRAGNLTQLGQDIANGVRDAGGNIIKNIENIGGKIICNELHRQGYLSDEIIKLDEEFGKKYRKQKRRHYAGYLLVARHIVPIMQKYPITAKLISYISIPWAHYMAHTMDPKIPSSKLGTVINYVGEKLCLGIYHANRFYRKLRK